MSVHRRHHPHPAADQLQEPENKSVVQQTKDCLATTACVSVFAGVFFAYHLIASGAIDLFIYSAAMNQK